MQKIGNQSIDFLKNRRYWECGGTTTAGFDLAAVFPIACERRLKHPGLGREAQNYSVMRLSIKYIAWVEVLRN